MKRAIAVLLCLIAIFSLTACGSTPAQPATAESSVSSPAEAEKNEAPATEAAEYTEIELTMATYYSAGGAHDLVLAFKDYVEKNTDGKVKINLYDGGSLCSMMEEYQFVKDGSVDIAAVLPAVCTAQLPFIYVVQNVKSNEDIIEFADWLYFENAETAAIVEKYTAAEGVKLLGTVTVGSSCVCSTFEFETLEDLKGCKFGTGRDVDVFNGMGMNTVNVPPTEAYESLSRGVCDCLMYTISSINADGLVEVAPYCGAFKKYSSNNDYIMNRETWDKLNDATKQVFCDAMDIIQVKSCEIESEAASKLEASAKSFRWMSEEDSVALTEAMEQASHRNLLNAAKNIGDEAYQDMMTIINAKAAYTGLNVIPE